MEELCRFPANRVRIGFVMLLPIAAPVATADGRANAKDSTPDFESNPERVLELAKDKNKTIKLSLGHAWYSSETFYGRGMGGCRPVMT